MSGDGLIGDRYGLVRQIGTGTLGAVWEAEDSAAGTHVALKLLSLPTKEVGERLAAEARAALAAKHPTLVTMYDVGETKTGEPFVAMELLTGETLADRLARERALPSRIAAQIGRDIAQALTVAHAARLVHGDIRPANVFLVGEPGAEEPAVKLLDLWVARAVPAAVAETLGLSAPSYRSPEQLASPEAYDVRSDLWSLGVLLFEILAGQRPFEGSRADVAQRITSGVIPRISQVAPGVDPALEEIVARCMERERDKRIGSAMVVSHMLEVFAAEGRKAPPPPPASSGEESSKSHQLATMQLDSGLGLPRGQLGTLVMSEGAPDTPLPSPSSRTGPTSGPLGTLVMAPGGPEPPRQKPARPDLTPLPRDPEPTQVFVEGTADAYAPTALPPAMPGAQPGLSTIMSARQPQMTVTEVHQQVQAAQASTDNGKILAISVVVAIVVLVGLFVVFVLI